KNGESVGLEPPNVSSPTEASAASTDGLSPISPPPSPTEVVPGELQPPVVSPSVTPASTEVNGPIPANLFASPTETATSTDDATTAIEAPQAPAEISNELLQPVSSPVFDPTADAPTAVAPVASPSEAIQPATPSILESFLAEAQQSAPQNLFPSGGLQQS